MDDENSVIEETDNKKDMNNTNTNFSPTNKTQDQSKSKIVPIIRKKS